MKSLIVSYNTQKRTDNTVLYLIDLMQDGTPVELSADHTYTAKIVNDESLVDSIQLKVDSGHLVLDSKDLNLPAGIYHFEVWDEQGTSRSIYPDTGMKRLVINQNAQDLPEGEVSSITLDDFVKRFNDAVANASGGKIELKDYYTKEQVDSKLKDIPQPDLSGYAKTTDLPKVSIDTANRTVTVNGQTMTIPGPVDLSGLASKNDLAGLVKQTELAQYALKADLPDISGLESKEDAQAALALKADKADLNDYAKKSALPTVPDISGLETKADAKSAHESLQTAINGKADTSALADYAKKSDLPTVPDVSDLISKADADSTYESKADATTALNTKADKAELADYAKKTDLPTVPDMTQYETKADLQTVLNSKADISSLADYVKKADLPAGLQIKALTSAQYQALSDTEKKDPNVLYAITDE